MPLEPVPAELTLPREVYQDEQGQLWEVIGYITSPAAILEKVRTGERHTEIIGCPNADRFTRLRPVS